MSTLHRRDYGILLSKIVDYNLTRKPRRIVFRCQTLQAIAF